MYSFISLVLILSYLNIKESYFYETWIILSLLSLFINSELLFQIKIHHGVVFSCIMLFVCIISNLIGLEKLLIYINWWINIYTSFLLILNLIRLLILLLVRIFL